MGSIVLIYVCVCSILSEPSGNDQGQARNVPLGDDLGQNIYVSSPRNNAQGQGHIVVIEPENNTQPTINVPPKEEENIEQQGQELDESSANSQEQNPEQEQEEEENEDDIDKPLPKGARAKVSRPPGKRPAPPPGTG